MMNFPVLSSKGMTRPFLPGSRDILSKSEVKALKILSLPGLEENFSAAHKTGLNNISRSNRRISVRSLNRDHADLNVYKFGQGRNLYGFPAREGAFKILTIHFIDLPEPVHIG